MRLAAALLTVVALAGAPATQPPPSPAPDPIQDLLAGHWAGSGTILGQPSQVELVVERVLDARFTRLTWISHIGLAPKTQRFEGHAYYRNTLPGENDGTWFDSGGMVRPLRASRAADAVVTLWGSPETEQGETTYRRLSADTLEIVDRVRGKNGEWREFGRSTLTRSAR